MRCFATVSDDVLDTEREKVKLRYCSSGDNFFEASSHAFKHVLELCGIDSEKYHWHDLRHTYATLLKKNINNLKVISKVLGHATTNMTEEVYIDTQKEVIDLCNVMNNYAENLISQVRKNDEKIAQQDFDMAKMVDFLT